MDRFSVIPRFGQWGVWDRVSQLFLYIGSLSDCTRFRQFAEKQLDLDLL